MQKVVVAGIPRSGTTFVFNHFALKSNKLGKIVLDVVKTHGFAPPMISHDPLWVKTERFIVEGAKCVFMFGDPILSVISTKLHIYNNFHARNCGCYEDLRKIDIYDCDHLNYEGMFDSWMRPHGYPVVSVRYETLPKHLRDINKFLDIEFDWYPFRARTTKYKDVNEHELLKIKKTYASLISKINKAPDFKVW